MWALGESLEVIGQDIKVYFKTKVVNIDCEKTQIITEGDATGQFTFDLIVGADGVGSVVRKARKYKIRGFYRTICWSLESSQDWSRKSRIQPEVHF